MSPANGVSGGEMEKVSEKKERAEVGPFVVQENDIGYRREWLC